MSNPIISNQTNIVANIGETIALSPSLRTGENFLYQWSYSSQVNTDRPNKFVDIPDATGQSLNITLSNQNLYWYILKITDTDTGITYTTNPSQLGIFPFLPNVTGLPLYVYANTFNTKLGVYPSSSYYYEWQKKDIASPLSIPNSGQYIPVVSGSANEILLNNLTLADHNSLYRIFVSGDSSTWMSPPITLVVDPNIEIIKNNIEDITVSAAPVSKRLFVISSVRNGEVLYSWQKSKNDTDFIDISGANQNFINLNLDANNIGEKYRVKLNSNIARAYVKYSPISNIINPSFVSLSSSGNINIISQSEDATITSTGISLFVNAQSDLFLNYQWIKSSDKLLWSDLPTETGSIITRSFDGFAKIKEYYKCKISNTENTIMSDVIELDLNIKSYLINSPSGITVSDSGNFTCQFFSNQTGSFDYSWYRFPISGLGVFNRIIDQPLSISSLSNNIYQSTLNVTGLNVVNNDVDRYIFVAKNKIKNNIEFISDQAYLSVINTITVISGLPKISKIVAGESGSLAVNVTSSAPPVSYQWYKSINSGLSFSAIPNETLNSLSFDPATIQDNRTLYRIEITDSKNRLVLP